MYQFSVHIQDPDHGFTHALEELEQQISSLPTDRLLFRVYSTVFSGETLSDLISALYERFLGSRIVCCTVGSGVQEYAYQNGIIISAEVFERQDSRAEVRSYELANSTDQAVAAEIVQFVQENPWVKAVEICRTVHDMNTTDFCEKLSELPKDVIVFGGLVCAEYMSIEGSKSYIADQSGWGSRSGMIAVYYGGSDLHVKTYKMSGWKPIDKPFTVTKAEKNIIMEIDNAPAHELFKRYLDIDPDDAFALNVLEFPFLSQDQNHSVVRNVFSLTPDGGLVVAYDVNVGTKLRLCYADAESVVEDIHTVSRELMQFTPDVISIVSCVTRSMIWQMKEYMPELQGFQPVAPCHGYLSHGELLREDGVLNHHNTILIAAAFREGDIKDVSYPEASLNATSQIPLTVRLSTFISRVTDELKEMYSEVEQAATTDALTKIGNRYLFDAVVKSVSANMAHANTKYLLMFDLNELKYINDTFGHNEGDRLIKAAADTISGVFSQYGQCFRIGGDEFAVIADFENDAMLQHVLNELNETLRVYNSTAPFTLSMAVGYAALVNAQGKLLPDSDWKMAADINMYKDKERFHAVKFGLLSQDMADFIFRIISLIDNKNSASAHHSMRVQRMALMIAKSMQLEEMLIKRVNLGAYLHDIGKLGISDTILAKTEPLSDEERLLLRRKPAIGRRLLMTSEETKEVADIIYACYECWDGSGYPEGLSGNDIPLEARIIAVAEFIDLALHDRYGLAALSTEECIKQLREKSGSMFDPAVVSVALSNFEEITKGDVTI